MQINFSGQGFMVIDDFLPPSQFDDVCSYVRKAEYRHVHADKWRKVYRLADGDPFEGPLVYSRAPSDMDPSALSVYPTGRPIDALFDRISEYCVEWKSLIGTFGKDWDIVTAKTHIYQPGTSLSWHGDGPGRTGAYTLYAHPRWDAYWGGETLIAESRPQDGITSEKASGYDAVRQSLSLLQPGCGSYVLPIPNRILILSAGQLHRVNPIHPGSGGEMRCSVSGFFDAVPLKSRLS